MISSPEKTQQGGGHEDRLKKKKVKGVTRSYQRDGPRAGVE